MKIRIVISVLLAFVAGSESAVAQTTSTADATTAQTTTQGSATTRKHMPAQNVTPVADGEREKQMQLERALALLREQARLLRQQRMFPQPVPPVPPPPASQPRWLLPLLVVTVAASLIGAALQPFLFRRARTLLHASAIAVRDVEAKVDAGVRSVLEKVQGARTDLAERVGSTRDATLEQLSSLSSDLGHVRQELARLTTEIERNTAPPPSAGDSVRLEHQVLAEHWKQFRERKELSAAWEVATQDNPWETLLAELAALVPADLRPSFDAVLTPFREHRQLVQKIGIVPHVVKGEMPLSSDAAELKRARDLTQLLIAVQGPDGNGRLHFRFQSWVTDTFLPFADLYLQSYQKALLEQRDGELRKGMSLVRQILRAAAVEPVEVTLGETRFDSTRHIGRLTSSDPRFSDGVITGVVRNGFIEGGHQVIRQPEVIVNRVR